MGKIFDFAWTCPDINKQIEKIQSELLELAEEIITDVSPYVEGNALLKIKNQWGASMYERIEQYVEAVRSTNSDMRDSAEKQIEAVIEERDTLQSENKDLHNQIKELEAMIEQLEAEVQWNKDEKELNF